MSYEINKTSGTSLASLGDNELLVIGDSANGITLFGKNTANYGERLNENFLRLLENFAKATEPSTPQGQSPIIGQLWWDTTNNVLKVRADSVTWKPVGTPVVRNTEPSTAIPGDLWFDSSTGSRQLKIYTDKGWQLVGPESVTGQGNTGVVVDTISGNPIVKITLASDDVAIFTNATINLGVGVLPDFPRILYPGINFRTASENGGINTGALRVSSAGIVPKNDGVQNLGASSFKFNNVHANTFYGDGSQITNVAASTAGSATNATNTTNVGVAVNATSPAKYVAFVPATTGNQPVQVNENLNYNPLTGLLKAPSIETSGQVEVKATGTVPPFVVASSALVTNLHTQTADKWHTARTFTFTGAVTGANTAVDGSGNVTIDTTLGAGISIGLTSLSGNIVSNIAAGTGVTVTGTLGPGWTPTVSIGQAVGTTNHVQFAGIGVGTTPSGISGEIRTTGDITAFWSSDIALKENISVIDHALEKLNNIRGVQFDWKDSHIQQRGGEDGYFVRKHDVGVIAQEVEQVLPEIVAKKENGTLGVRYEKLVSLLIEAVKELDSKVKSLENEIKKNAL